jgi:outer membrane lipase/esterase
MLARALAGFGLCAAALSASAGPYAGLVVFGDSLSDGGNNAAIVGTTTSAAITGNSVYSRIPYEYGTYTNGMVWTQYLAQSLGVALTPSVIGGSNFAFGGAQTGIDGNETPLLPGFPYSMKTQVGMYLGATGGAADPNALYIVAGGGNNIRVALEALTPGTDPNTLIPAMASAYAADMVGMVDSLKLAGAKHVLVVNTPNFGLTPMAHEYGVEGLASLLSLKMDEALGGALGGSGVMTFDLYKFMTDAVTLGSGFSDVTHACGAAVNNCTSPSTALFWDSIHPTTLGHQSLATAVLAVAVPEPDVVALFAVGLVVIALSRRRRAALQQG